MKPIDQLSPEEMRVEIAEAMGAKWYTFVSGHRWLSFKRLADHFTLSTRPSDLEIATIHEGVPNYPENANAALSLASALAEKGWRWRAATEDTHSETLFQFVNDEFAFEATATGPHAFALALCRAYLAVVRSTQNP